MILVAGLIRQDTNKPLGQNCKNSNLFRQCVAGRDCYFILFNQTGSQSHDQRDRCVMEDTTWANPDFLNAH
jgi:hypothetical protein